MHLLLFESVVWRVWIPLTTEIWKIAVFGCLLCENFLPRFARARLICLFWFLIPKYRYTEYWIEKVKKMVFNHSYSKYYPQENPGAGLRIVVRYVFIHMKRVVLTCFYYFGGFIGWNHEYACTIISINCVINDALSCCQQFTLNIPFDDGNF